MIFMMNVCVILNHPQALGLDRYRQFKFKLNDNFIRDEFA